MPSYATEQKERALQVFTEWGDRVTRAIRKLGYLSRQTTCKWTNEADSAHLRAAGRGGRWATACDSPLLGDIEELS